MRVIPAVLVAASLGACSTLIDLVGSVEMSCDKETGDTIATLWVKDDPTKGGGSERLPASKGDPRCAVFRPVAARAIPLDPTQWPRSCSLVDKRPIGHLWADSSKRFGAGVKLAIGDPDCARLP